MQIKYNVYEFTKDCKKEVLYSKCTGLLIEAFHLECTGSNKLTLPNKMYMGPLQITTHKLKDILKLENGYLSPM